MRATIYRGHSLVRLAFVCALLILLLHVPVATHAAASIKTIKADYEKALRSIRIVCDKRIRETLGRYGSHLKIAEDIHRKQGDLDGLLATRDEMKRFKTEKKVPELSETPPTAIIGRARDFYHASVAQAKADKPQFAQTALKRYISALEKLLSDTSQEFRPDVGQASI